MSDMPKEYGIDFKTGNMTGKIVEGIEAIKVWVYLVLKTTKYRYWGYSWNYGNELEDLIGKQYSKEYINSEAKRMLEDCLLINENIISISNVETSMLNDKLTISFNINTKFGEEVINV